MVHRVYGEEVDITVQAGGQKFLPISIETEMYSRGGSNHCLITGLLPNGTRPRPGQDIEITINGNRVFTGYGVRADRTKDSIYNIEGYSTRFGMARIKGTLTTKDGQMFNVRAFQHEMEEANIPNYRFDAGGTYGGSGIPTRHEYSNKNMVDIVDDLAKRLDAFWWVDEYGTVVFSNSIREGGRRLMYVKEIEIGDQSSTKDTTVVYGGSPASQSGTEFATMILEDRMSTKETKESEEETYGGNFRGLFQPAREEVHKRKNLQSQEEVNAAAISFMWEHYEDIETGTVTIVGQSNVYPWQRVMVPDSPETRDMASGEYIAKAVRHRINEQDGFVTEVDIMSTKVAD